MAFFFRRQLQLADKLDPLLLIRQLERFGLFPLFVGFIIEPVVLMAPHRINALIRRMIQGLSLSGGGFDEKSARVSDVNVDRLCFQIVVIVC